MARKAVSGLRFTDTLWAYVPEAGCQEVDAGMYLSQWVSPGTPIYAAGTSVVLCASP